MSMEKLLTCLPAVGRSSGSKAGCSGRRWLPVKTTVRGVLIQLTDTQKAFLDDLMERYGAAVRWSFKRLLDNWEVQAIRLAVQDKFSLNSRQANDAVGDANATVKSQKEQVLLHHAAAANKAGFTKKRLERATSSEKKTKLTRRLDKEDKEAGLLAEVP